MKTIPHTINRLTMNRLLWIGLLIAMTVQVSAQHDGNSALVIVRVKYRGGGDWYNDPSALPNLARFIRQHTLVDIAEREVQIGLTDESLFAYPILFITGHGQMSLSDIEAERLRLYLLRGGFLYADDDYGLDTDFRKAMEKVFPDRHFTELPFSHGLYKTPFRFENGLPKIHEHDDKPPQGFGLFDDDGRLMVYYTFESNISDGWADPQVHDNPEYIRETALKMGTNIILWALTH